MNVVTDLYSGEPWPFGGLTPSGYDGIVADPDWNMKTNSVAKPGRNPRRHYVTHSVKEIASIPVGLLAKPDCQLFLWITGPFFAIGAHLVLMKAWGFKPSAVGFTWIKLNKRAPELFFMRQDIAMGNGFTTRKNAEFVVLGKRGRSVRKNAGVHEVIVAPKREHSRKPDEARQRIEKYLGPDARIVELFSRQTWPGHDTCGDQAGLFDTAA